MPLFKALPDGLTSINAFTQTVSKTIANTTTETSALGTGVGSLVISANTMREGQRISISGGGIYSTALVVPTMTVKVKINGVVIAQTTVSSLINSMTNAAFDFSCRMIVRSVGSSGKIVSVGGLNFAAAAGGRIFGDLVNGGNPVTIDTTTDQTVDVSVAWGTASASNSVTITSANLSL